MLFSKVDAEVEETYTYDKRGNLSQITSNGQVKNQYLYGALNRLEQAVNGKGDAARYQYNGLGHRVGKEIGQENFQTINEGLDPIKRLQSQTVSPEKQVQYTIDLTREYHNLLQKDILATDINKSGIVTDIYFLGNDEKRENMAGWLGDATIKANNAPPSFSGDDYIADLDARNVTYLMEKEGYSYVNATKVYYSRINSNYTRAQMF